MNHISTYLFTYRRKLTLVEMGHSNTISHCLAQDLLEVGVPGILQGTSGGKAANKMGQFHPWSIVKR